MKRFLLLEPDSREAAAAREKQARAVPESNARRIYGESFRGIIVLLPPASECGRVIFVAEPAPDSVLCTATLDLGTSTLRPCAVAENNDD